MLLAPPLLMQVLWVLPLVWMLCWLPAWLLGLLCLRMQPLGTLWILLKHGSLLRLLGLRLLLGCPRLPVIAQHTLQVLDFRGLLGLLGPRAPGVPVVAQQPLQVLARGLHSRRYRRRHRTSLGLSRPPLGSHGPLLGIQPPGFRGSPLGLRRPPVSLGRPLLRLDPLQRGPRVSELHLSRVHDLAAAAAAAVTPRAGNGKDGRRD
mmetsp:Transcript_58770/g.164034  ORF Transcript_58770/g.164034 Transcript_58770/m.164034 type:complete len:205 (+) Transcript_58770:1194-1808(+)